MTFGQIFILENHVLAIMTKNTILRADLTIYFPNTFFIAKKHVKIKHALGTDHGAVVTTFNVVGKS